MTDCRALGMVDRYQMNFADRLWTVKSCDMRSDGKTLSGSAIFAGVSDAELRHRCVEQGCAHPQPKGPLNVTLRAEFVGDSLFGSATCSYDGIEHESAIQGRWRSFPYAIHADRTPRLVEPDLQPDPELAEAALKEAMIPIRPGEPGSAAAKPTSSGGTDASTAPGVSSGADTRSALAKPGKRDFWTEYARLGGCSQSGEKDGHRIVQYGNKLTTIEEFRKARGHDKEQPYSDFFPRDGHGYVTDETGFSVGQYVTIHDVTKNGGAGNPPIWSDGTQETRRIVSIDAGQNRLVFDKPFLQPHASGDLVTNGLNLHTSIFHGGPGVVYAVGERPSVIMPPKYDDLMIINRLGWRGFLKFQVFRPEFFEVIVSAGSTD